MVQRSTDFLEYLQNRYPQNQRIILVSHRENVGIIMWLITGHDTDADILTGLENCTPYTFEFDHIYEYPY